jgi:hypothetical protein
MFQNNSYIMKDISHNELNEKGSLTMDNPEKEVQATAKKKHQIIYFEWTIRLLWQFIRHQIRKVVKKIIRNPFAA